MPAMVTYKAKGVVPDDHPWFAGVFTNGAIERPLIDESDLLIGIGLDPVELLPRPWTWQPRSSPARRGGSTRGTCRSSRSTSRTSPTASATSAAWLKPSDWRLDSVRRHRAEQRRRLDIRADGLTAQQRASPRAPGRAVLAADGAA